MFKFLFSVFQLRKLKSDYDNLLSGKDCGAKSGGGGDMSGEAEDDDGRRSK